MKKKISFNFFFYFISLFIFINYYISFFLYKTKDQVQFFWPVSPCVWIYFVPFESNTYEITLNNFCVIASNLMQKLRVLSYLVYSAFTTLNIIKNPSKCFFFSLSYCVKVEIVYEIIIFMNVLSFLDDETGNLKYNFISSCLLYFFKEKNKF